ncbi:MAG: dTDP-4-dehydrorhamnose reductase [Leptospira sp.]|nr:dTDP-4-dehydrorhamnose reductase [Leptospira sp.]
MLNILVTGANGQLGSEVRHIAEEFKTDFSFHFVTRSELDLTSEHLVESFLLNYKIDGILNAAAYTAVDLAEKESERAMEGNVTIPSILAKLCKKHSLKLLHFSTDFVFDGKSFHPYNESDKIAPISIYGQSKAEGERAVLSQYHESKLIRTSWVYSKFGHNFLKTILRLSAEKPELRVIADQIGSPTWARDLARASLSLLKSDATGIFHFSNEGVASWYDFAKAILEEGGKQTPIIPIETKDYPTPATRPPYSVLNKSRIKQTLNIQIPHWRDSLRNCMSEIL